MLSSINVVDGGLKEINGDLMNQLEVAVERADNLLGLLAVERDLLGQLAIGLYHSKHSVMPHVKDVKKIDELIPYMTAEQRSYIKTAVKFHMAAKKLNELHPELKPAWGDDYPLHEIERLNFMSVIDSYD